MEAKGCVCQRPPWAQGGTEWKRVENLPPRSWHVSGFQRQFHRKKRGGGEGILGREECRSAEYKTESIAWTRAEHFEFFKHKPSDTRDLRIIWSPQWDGSVRGLSLNVCIQLAWPRGPLARTLYSSALSLMQEHRLPWSCFRSGFLFPRFMLWKLDSMCNNTERWWDFQEVRIGTEIVAQGFRPCGACVRPWVCLITDKGKNNHD